MKTYDLSGFPYMGVSKMLGFSGKIHENPIKMEGLGVPLFEETTISTSNVDKYGMEAATKAGKEKTPPKTTEIQERSGKVGRIPFFSQTYLSW